MYRRSILLNSLLLLLLLSCGASNSSSDLMTSREARYVLGASRNFPSALLDGIDHERMEHDWMYQRQSFWGLWTFLFQRSADNPKEKINRLENWQSWYSSDDFARIFKQLYTGLGKERRLQRASLSEADISQAFRWHDSEQFAGPTWDKASFERWESSFEGEAMQRSMPGLNKILLNQTALAYILASYPAIYRCLRQPNARESCLTLAWPRGAALLKTAWRRSGDGFQIADFGQGALALDSQLKALEWTAHGAWIPPSGVSYTMQTRSGQTFHLAGMHLMLKLQEKWLWTSIWLGREADGDLATDHPADLAHYRLCGVTSFRSALDELSSKEKAWPLGLRESASVLRQNQLSNWCSNPFLELGLNSQKTNCIACHQFSGLNWSRETMRRKLEFDLPSFQQPSTQLGPSDFVWSLLNGPDALALILADTIEYFDAYDPY